MISPLVIIPLFVDQALVCEHVYDPRVACPLVIVKMVPQPRYKNKMSEEIIKMLIQTLKKVTSTEYENHILKGHYIVSHLLILFRS